MDAAGAARARRGINRRGHLVSFRRLSKEATPQIVNRADVKATVAGYALDQLVSGISVGTRKLIVSKLDLEAQGFPIPPVKGDKVYLGATFNTPLTIDAVDGDHREYQACYEIVAKGT